MKFYGELKSKMEATQQHMFEAKKNECAKTLRKVKVLCKEFGSSDGALKGALA